MRKINELKEVYGKELCEWALPFIGMYKSDSLIDAIENWRDTKYCDILWDCEALDFIRENPEEVEEVLDEFGWKRGESLVNLGRIAICEFMFKNMMSHISEIILLEALERLSDRGIEEIHQDQWEELCDRLGELTENSTMDEIAEATDSIFREGENENE